MKHFCILQTTKNYIIKISFLIILKLFSFLINKNYSIKSWILGVNNDFSSNDRENHQLKITATTQKSIYDLQEETHSHRYKSKKSKIKNKILRIYLSDKFFFFFTHHESSTFLNTALHACKSNFSTREGVLPVRSSW